MTPEEHEALALKIERNLREVGQPVGERREDTWMRAEWEDKALETCLMDDEGICIIFLIQEKVTANFNLSKQAASVLHEMFIRQYCEREE